MPSLDMVCSSALEEFTRHHHAHLPPWEKRLVAAQSVLFNKELFTMVSSPSHVPHSLPVKFLFCVV